MPLSQSDLLHSYRRSSRPSNDACCFSLRLLSAHLTVPEGKILLERGGETRGFSLLHFYYYPSPLSRAGRKERLVLCRKPERQKRWKSIYLWGEGGYQGSYSLMDTNFDEGARISPIQPRLLSSFFRDRENGSLSRAIIKKERVQQRSRRSRIIFHGRRSKIVNVVPSFPPQSPFISYLRAHWKNARITLLSYALVWCIKRRQGDGRRGASARHFRGSIEYRFPRRPSLTFVHDAKRCYVRCNQFSAPLPPPTTPPVHVLTHNPATRISLSSSPALIHRAVIVVYALEHYNSCF